ncbi:MAG: hypothetical protein KJ737_23175 [Proteobacteria bacterium]|nr:hypothetical protein [Pseudomonadota bacterium]
MKQVMMIPRLAEQLSIPNTINKESSSFNRDHHIPKNNEILLQGGILPSEVKANKQRITSGTENIHLMNLSDEVFIMSGIERLKETDLFETAQNNPNKENIFMILS